LAGIGIFGLLFRYNQMQSHGPIANVQCFIGVKTYRPAAERIAPFGSDDDTARTG